MPGPPVAMIILTSGACMSSFVAAIVARLTPWMTFSGAPAATAASFMSLMARFVHLAAFGCGEKTMALRAFSAIIDL